MKTSAGLQTSGTTEESDDEPRIEGPIPEFDKYGDYTGYDYFRCTECGAEAIRRCNLRDEVVRTKQTELEWETNTDQGSGVTEECE